MMRARLKCFYAKYAVTKAADNYVIVKGDCKCITQFFDVFKMNIIRQ